MPHIIIEYADQLADDAEVVAILQAVHHAIADSGLFKANQIKTRACPFRQFTNAGGNDPYIHIQARIKSGRDADNKKRLGEVILAGLSALKINASVITVEIIDMDRDSYGKHVPKQQ
ncbi:MAG: 5-carboxymethyl-2-hydroxymuconate Delta-isomerase [Gammaproteobacteria bacterium]|nr:5-carboxymethyl-2-hydroxymuconate Delta-isomerase [Gammaproteobacteria bacterium]MBT6454536.1 5-carboxymethyl-2-hydroxymuconate Delta-isomerase [Gammaproteobacteria bacterium]MBT6553069.1 5-carboxymethyl-2-hydroxymuconate Delta-isomerase [Gammaproteobacteria bacterium]MBT6700216.1 5-carboxymethyl-2-hydroxymuconate Delta-isomerase [Gammaproteobacteria bacterium]MBT7045857.1 5-carboxymethyl-2-hydroxymuconate Delta-isomerase [Gammaproteobacteria bacterium]